MATHSSILVREILWTEEPGGLQSIGSQRVAMSFSRGSSHPRDWTHISCVSSIAGEFFTTEPLGKPMFGGDLRKSSDRLKNEDSFWEYK